MAEPLLAVRELSVAYGDVTAVDSLSFDLLAGECLGLAGESGSGKSTVAHAILRTLPPPAVIFGGSVRFAGIDVLTRTFAEMQRLRWKEFAVVFQSALNALNPVVRIEDQIVDTILAHEDVAKSVARERALGLLERVELPRRIATAYAHELSGGMRQRAVIAIALCLGPRLLVLDEPTTALDVITQKAILTRLTELRRELGFSILFITHDLPLLFDYADRALILYAGRLAELGPVSTLATKPRHPYTRALVDAIPRASTATAELRAIPGQPPTLRALPSGCRFHPRCQHRSSECERTVPVPQVSGTLEVSCHHPLS